MFCCSTENSALKYYPVRETCCGGESKKENQIITFSYTCMASCTGVCIDNAMIT